MPTREAHHEHVLRKHDGRALAFARGASRAAEDEGKSDAAIEKGVAWLAANFAADHNPTKAPGSCRSTGSRWSAARGKLLATSTSARTVVPRGRDFLLRTSTRPGSGPRQGEFMKAEKMDVLDACSRSSSPEGSR
jgi:hypothetical protein